MDTESKCPVSESANIQPRAKRLATAAYQIATTNAPKDLRAYRCSWCDSWHLTKNAGREGKIRTVKIAVRAGFGSTSSSRERSTKHSPYDFFTSATV